jgi:Na+-transporting NADH:ubiquinone oxidoreductase subunit NqrD
LTALSISAAAVWFETETEYDMKVAVAQILVKIFSSLAKSLYYQKNQNNIRFIESMVRVLQY